MSRRPENTSIYHIAEACKKSDNKVWFEKIRSIDSAFSFVYSWEDTVINYYKTQSLNNQHYDRMRALDLLSQAVGIVFA